MFTCCRALPDTLAPTRLRQRCRKPHTMKTSSLFWLTWAPMPRSSWDRQPKLSPVPRPPGRPLKAPRSPVASALRPAPLSGSVSILFRWNRRSASSELIFGQTSPALPKWPRPPASPVSVVRALLKLWRKCSWPGSSMKTASLMATKRRFQAVFLKISAPFRIDFGKPKMALTLLWPKPMCAPFRWPRRRFMQAASC